MLGHPVSPVTQPLDMAREIERVAQCLPGVAAFDNGGEIENRKRDHSPTMTRHGPRRKPARQTWMGDAIRGIITFDTHVTQANGHLDLSDGNTFYDEVYGMSHAGRDFFDMARRVSLWVTEESSVCQQSPDA